MKPKPKIFTFDNEAEFNSVRVVITTDIPWYFGADVAVPLGFTKPQRAINNHVPAVQKKRADFTVKGGRPWLINEEGVCALIEFSKMPMGTVRKFADWMHDVVFVQANQECDKMFDEQDAQNRQQSLFDGGQNADGNGDRAATDDRQSADGNSDRADGQELTVSVFDDKDFGEIRYVLVDGEPWFIAADVCRILELGNTSQAVSRLDRDEKMTVTVPARGIYSTDTRGGNQTMLAVNEPGLYRLIFASRIPKAKKFQRKVYHEILPSIRKTGSYSVGGVPTSGDTTVTVPVTVVNTVANVPAVDPEQKRLAAAYDYGALLAKLIFAPNSPPTHEIAKIIVDKIFE